MSNILKNTFNLTKEIESNQKRDSIKQMFSELHKSKLTGDKIGYYGSHQYKQFLGYLVIYNDRDRINKESPIKIEELPNETIEFLTYGHSYIKSLNRMLLKSLLELIPSSYKVLDPYWIMENLKTYSNEIDISSSSVNSLIKSFQLAKPFEVIKNRLNYMPQIRELKEQDIANAVYSIIERIKHFGLKNCPEDLLEMKLRVNLLKPESILSAIILSLINIHSALQVIDQIIFQSFVSDKLISLDKTNIYSVSYMGSNGLSDIIEVCSSELVHLSGEIIIIDLPFKELPKKKFCMVKQIQIKFSQEYGNEFIVGTRCVDESASGYTNLIKNIELL